MTIGWPDFRYIYANWTASQFKIMLKAAETRLERERQAVEDMRTETHTSGKGAVAGREIKQVSDTEMFATLGVTVQDHF